MQGTGHTRGQWRRANFEGKAFGGRFGPCSGSLARNRREVGLAKEERRQGPLPEQNCIVRQRRSAFD